MKKVQNCETFWKINKQNITYYTHKLNASRNEASKLLSFHFYFIIHFNTQNQNACKFQEFPKIKQVHLYVICWENEAQYQNWFSIIAHCCAFIHSGGTVRGTSSMATFLRFPFFFLLKILYAFIFLVYLFLKSFFIIIQLFQNFYLNYLT